MGIRKIILKWFYVFYVSQIEYFYNIMFVKEYFCNKRKMGIENNGNNKNGNKKWEWEK